MALTLLTRVSLCNAPFAFIEQHRKEMAEIARSKLRMARADHEFHGLSSERRIELLEDWVASFHAYPLYTHKG